MPATDPEIILPILPHELLAKAAIVAAHTGDVYAIYDEDAATIERRYRETLAAIDAEAE